jgi:YQGE family putative transporter
MFGKELEVFKSQPRNLRILLSAFMLYALVMPVMNVFVGSYIMRNSQDVGKVVLYQLMIYTGIPVTAWLNGYLLNRLKGSWLYALGMFLSGVAMFVMTSIRSLDNRGIAVAGLLMGGAAGLFWSNRNYLVLKSTNDENRNYYQGSESFMGTFCNVFVPVLVGWAIAVSPRIVGTADINAAYRLMTFLVMLLTAASACIILRGDFESPKLPRFVYFSFHALWNKLLVLAAFKGMVQGFLVTAPAMLIMHVMKGAEGTLGTVQSVGAVLSAVLMYVIGRRAKPEHRLTIFGWGIWLFALGALLNGALFNSLAVILFMICMMFAQALLDIAYFPIQMKVIDHVAKLERRNDYAYILSHEAGLYFGRLFGCGLFLVIAYCVSREAALRVVLPLVALLQALSIPLAKHILRNME